MQWIEKIGHNCKSLIAIDSKRAGDIVELWKELKVESYPHLTKKESK